MERFVTDDEITQALYSVFGTERVIPPDHSKGSHDIFFDDKENANAVLKILDELNFSGIIIQCLGAFEYAVEPNISFVLGNDKMRRPGGREEDFNRDAAELIKILEAKRHELRYAATQPADLKASKTNTNVTNKRGTSPSK